MKKILSLIAISGLLTIGATQYAKAQNTDSTSATETTTPAETPAEPTEATASGENADEAPKVTFTQVLKEKFIEGDPRFMSLVLICLILGLAISIERIIYLNMATGNSEKFLEKVEAALKSGGVEAAKEICRNTRGPVASIAYQALMRVDEGPDNVEKAIISYGSVQNGQMENGLTWLSLFIALAPMLGFLGTVIGMIQAFDDIARAGNISPQIVADGIKVALLTTVGGLIVAMILQLFYNYLLSKIDNLVIDMENSSISIMDILLKHKVFPGK
ncbi:MAG TPA: flagellar motor protein MotA [Flavobacteriales bacterium]|nr:flagellar motor protein MotA [Flavobacteriales bacterium]HCA82156.1 flagellar motor protein MotA [Flavobacteriales bacterium]HRE73521.1 MotA/TolQ/ExbB proton channel family protein [Flavobacteriales bacterium]HRJ34627.1 MotA/TolQ/ExbB proton channel family protein [Flavobacteriales bacterium]HRJ37345.1 MotA/TolQ/ExbB proton channel family protein [Flavobacteriales bacterium]